MTPRAGESAKQFEARKARFRKNCEETFSHPAGRQLLAEMIASHHPMQPRTHSSLTTQESAFLDGELSVLAFFILNSGQTDLLSIQPKT